MNRNSNQKHQFNIEHISSQWLSYNRHAYKPNTIQKYRYHLKKYILPSSLSQKLVCEITSMDLADFSDSLINQNLSYNTINDVPEMFKVIDKIHKGDYGGALGYLVDKAGMALDSDGNISYTGLKIKAVGKTIDLVLGKDSYIIANDDKYKAKAESSLRHGDILGFVWNGGGDFIQTVGKGTVDVSCQLVSDTIDAYISQSTGGLLTLTTVNKMLNDTIGTSPGHMFNACTKAVSDATDFCIDKGGDFLGELAKQSYSDLAEFGNLVGKAGKGISKVSGGIVSAIKGWF